MSWELAVRYREVALVAREWDEQHLDLRSAAGLVDAIAAGSFPGPVRGAVGTFRDAWARHLTAIAVSAESRADGLRSAVEVYLASDEHTALELGALVGLVASGVATEVR